LGGAARRSVSSYAKSTRIINSKKAKQAAIELRIRFPTPAPGYQHTALQGSRIAPLRPDKKSGKGGAMIATC